MIKWPFCIFTLYTKKTTKLANIEPLENISKSGVEKCPYTFNQLTNDPKIEENDIFKSNPNCNYLSGLNQEKELTENLPILTLVIQKDESKNQNILIVQLL